MRDIMSELFKWDQDIFLQNLFISLDTKTLRRCCEVSKLWREFINRRVWGCARLRPGLIVRLWTDFHPVQQELVVRGAVTSIACDDQIMVCGYTDGTCEVFNEETGECIDTFDDNEEGIHYTSSKVTVGENIIEKISYGSDQSDRAGNSYFGIWRKIAFQKMFESVQDDEKDYVYLLDHGKDEKLSKAGKYQKSGGMYKILEDSLKDVKYLPKRDFCTDGIYFVFGMQHEICICEVRCETKIRKVSMESNIVNLTMRDHNVLILQDFKFSVLDLDTDKICLKGENSFQLISTSSNAQIVSILDAQNFIKLYTWTDLTNPNLPTCLPIHTFSLPIPTSPYTIPCICLSQTTLIAATTGSNSIFSYQLWRDRPQLARDGEE
eukprot:GFUD01061613.1.p1 GENE.GFUD01061613.1~~GFUD01061613.1.p1  ORF type:complete len:379 (+),score=78.07 GFUD01061613.1:176-1312(+)